MVTLEDLDPLADVVLVVDDPDDGAPLDDAEDEVAAAFVDVPAAAGLLMILLVGEVTMLL